MVTYAETGYETRTKKTKQKQVDLFRGKIGRVVERRAEEESSGSCLREMV